MDQPIVIIGAGIAGLIAAYHLEEAGFSPVIIDQNDRCGGRIRTDQKEGFRLDQGFQVLLTAYQEAQRYLDLEALDLCHFEPGAVVYNNNKKFQLYDPLRDWTKGPAMLFSGIGTLKDKYLIWKLTQQLKATSEDLLFGSGQKPTIAFLKDFGFSSTIISQFFIPFFGGIYLENELNTPSPMFKFVFKKFSTGSAAIPNQGIEAIPQQLKSKLKKTRFIFDAHVEKIEGTQLLIQNQDAISFDRLIIAADPFRIVPGLANQVLSYHSTLNLYFTTSQISMDRKVIGLIPDPTFQTNNFCVISDIASGYGNGKDQLISVSLKDSVEWVAETPKVIANEIKRITGIQNPPKFLHHYHIKQALPVIDQLAYDFTPTQFRLTDRIYLAGDHLLNASLDAAMRSGRRAAEALLGAT